MPLEPGSSREVVSRNIAREIRRGHPQPQAVAMALRNAGLSKYDAADWLDQVRDAFDTLAKDKARDHAVQHIHIHR